MHAFTTRLALILLTSMLVLAGCGSDDAADSGTATGIEAGKLTHVDGTIVVSADGFRLTPKNGDAAMEFTLGPEVQLGALKALESSGAAARVTFRSGDRLVAAAVVPAPAIGEDLESYVGTVSSIDDTQITLDGDDGERSFDISGAGEAAFDVAHLKDHSSEGSPVRVYFDPKAPKLGVTYEDA
jgi:hypothetical protein